MTFWERVEKALFEKKISVAELSRLVGLSQASLNNWRNGSIPRADYAVKVAEILGLSVEFLISGKQTAYEFTDPESGKTIQLGSNYFLIPVIEQKLSAGKGEPLPTTDEIQGLLAVPQMLRKFGKDIGVLFVHGDSMEPTLHNGDPVICSTSGWDNEEGLYAIRLNGNGYVKRIQIKADKIIIKSDNPLYLPIEEPLTSENFSIIGKVLCSVRVYV